MTGAIDVCRLKVGDLLLKIVVHHDQHPSSPETASS